MDNIYLNMIYPLKASVSRRLVPNKCKSYLSSSVRGSSSFSLPGLIQPLFFVGVPSFPHPLPPLTFFFSTTTSQMSAADTTVAVPAEEVKAVESPAPEPAPTTETPVCITLSPHHTLIHSPFQEAPKEEAKVPVRHTVHPSSCMLTSCNCRRPLPRLNRPPNPPLLSPPRTVPLSLPLRKLSLYVFVSIPDLGIYLLRHRLRLPPRQRRTRSPRALASSPSSLPRFQSPKARRRKKRRNLK